MKQYRVVTEYKGKWYIQAFKGETPEAVQEYINNNKDIVAETEKIYIAEEYQ